MQFETCNNFAGLQAENARRTFQFRATVGTEHTEAYTSLSLGIHTHTHTHTYIYIYILYSYVLGYINDVNVITGPTGLDRQRRLRMTNDLPPIVQNVLTVQRLCAGTNCPKSHI